MYRKPRWTSGGRGGVKERRQHEKRHSDAIYVQVKHIRRDGIELICRRRASSRKARAEREHENTPERRKRNPASTAGWPHVRKAEENNDIPAAFVPLSQAKKPQKTTGALREESPTPSYPRIDLSCLGLPCPIMSRLVLSYLVLSCRNMSRVVWSCLLVCQLTAVANLSTCLCVLPPPDRRAPLRRRPCSPAPWGRGPAHPET